jgi:hypothetical protein
MRSNCSVPRCLPAPGSRAEMATYRTIPLGRLRLPFACLGNGCAGTATGVGLAHAPVLEPSGLGSDGRL